jgi:hypothetical protein
MKADVWTKTNQDRRAFIGGSDARIIMGDDEGALVRLWREKRGEVEPEDLSRNLIDQLGVVTEHLNRHWYERNTGQFVTEVQRQVFHPVKRSSGRCWRARAAAPRPVPAAPVGRRRYPARSAAGCMEARRVPARQKQNQNALKHGVFTQQAIEERGHVQALLRQSRQLLKDID